MNDEVRLTSPSVMDRVNTVLVSLFWLCFALRFGIHIAGDAYALGKYLPYLQVLVPLSALLVAVIFFVSAGTRTFEITLPQIAFFLIFIAINLALAIFSGDMLTSAYNLILWVLAFMIWPCRSTFSLDSKIVQAVAWLGFVLGVILNYYYTGLVAMEVLALGGMWIWIQSLRHPHLNYLWLLSIAFWGLLWLTHQLLFLIICFVLWFGLKAWINRNQKTFDISRWILGMVILLAFIVSDLSFSFWDFSQSLELLSTWSDDMIRMIVGVGDRNFYQYFVDTGQFSLNPNNWHMPNSDALLVLLEKGIVGLLTYLSLISFPLWYSKTKTPLRVMLLLLSFLFTNAIWNEPTGIIVIGLILFSE